jgi:diacylglycerol kinase family enzyme
VPTDALERLADAGALTTPSARKRMLVIVNPYATTVSDRLRTLVLYALRGRYEVEAVDTQARGHATELCREAAHEGYDVVTCFGGDGTVSEAANGLAGSPTPLTCLPGGATNVLCRMLGIPGDVVDATEHLLRLADAWRPRPIDLGEVNGRLFTFASGVGLDASVVRRVDANPERKERMRRWYFASSAISTFLREYVVHPPALEVEVGGERVPGATLIVQNGDPLTYFGTRALRVAEGIALDDGTIAGAVLRRTSPMEVVTIGARLLGHRSVLGHREVHGFNGATEVRCRVVDGRPVPVEADGDHLGDELDVRYAVRPAALSVVA